MSIEAHLRGIPVISSTAGALPEAMRGLDYVIPVNPITGEHDEHGAYVVPVQDVGPWVHAVEKLMTDRSEYLRLSYKVRDRTEKWPRNLDETALENWLLDSVLRMDKWNVALEPVLGYLLAAT